jgi:hypothetical protein
MPNKHVTFAEPHKGIRRRRDDWSVRATTGPDKVHPQPPPQVPLLSFEGFLRTKPSYDLEKQDRILSIKAQFQHLHEQNNRSFMGGYTEPAIQSHKFQQELLRKQEEAQLAQLEKEYDGSTASRAAWMNKKLEEWKTRTSVSGGGAVGGGYNHPGVYAPVSGVHYGY